MCVRIKSLFSQCLSQGAFSGHLSSEAPRFLPRWGILMPSSHACPDMAAAAISEIRSKSRLLDNTAAHFINATQLITLEFARCNWP